MNAYELADELLRDNTQLTVKAAYMLRQQADRIAELEKEAANLQHSLKNALIFIDNHKQTKPLSDEEIWEWFEKNTALTKESALKIARAIEAKVRREK